MAQLYTPPVKERIRLVLRGQMTTTQIADALADRYHDMPRASLEETARAALAEMRQNGSVVIVGGRRRKIWAQR